MLNLYLLRHGKAANPEDFGSDYDRPLTKKGILQINQVGYKLLRDNAVVDQLLSSSAERTKETAKIANHYLGVKDVSYHEDLYLAASDTILNKLKNEGRGQAILYSGHNFGISDIATFLADDMYSMSTGMLIHMEFELQSWSELSRGTGRVVEAFAPNVYIP